VTTTTQSSEKVEPVVPPVSLRDWFAGQVVSVLKAPGFSVAYGDSECRTFARQAYKLADAMLAARKDDHDGR